MRKEIRSKSKRKWVVGGALFFGGIALLTTGFASWVVGLQVLSQNDSVGVAVDTAVNESVIFAATLSDASVSLREEHTKGAGEIIGTEDREDDLYGETDFTIKIGSATISRGGNNAVTPRFMTITTRSLSSEEQGDATDVGSALSFELDDDDNNLINDGKDPATKVRTDDSTATYVDIAYEKYYLTKADYEEDLQAEIDDAISIWSNQKETDTVESGGTQTNAEYIAISNANKDQFIADFKAYVADSGNSTDDHYDYAKASYDKIVLDETAAFKEKNTHFAAGAWDDSGNYSLSDATVTLFKWGTYFGNVSPCTYYNAQYKDGKIGSTMACLDDVAGELQYMASALSGTSALPATIGLTFTVSE